jgi:hypothetical protein
VREAGTFGGDQVMSRVLMNGCSALIKEAEIAVSSLLSCEVTEVEPSVVQEVGPRHALTAGTLILDFSVSRRVRNKVLMCVSHSDCGSLL